MDNQLTVDEVKVKLVELGISQPTMAKAIFVTKDYVNQVLNKRRSCSKRMLAKMNAYIDTQTK